MKRSLREILSEMDNRERVKYIWEYYRFFIIGFILLVILIIYSVNSVMNKKTDFLNIVMMGGFVDHSQIEAVEETLRQNILTEEELNSNMIRIQALRVAGDDQMDMQAGVDIQKMAAELSAGYIDFFIVDEEFFNQMNDEGQLASLQDLYGNDPLPFSEDDIFYAPDDQEITGIDLSAIPVFNDIFLDESKRIICVPVNTKNKNNVTRFLEYIASK